MFRIINGLKVLFPTAFPNLYIAYCLFWVLGLEGAALMTMGASNWELGLQTLLRILTVYFSLLLLTFIDEVKDIEYDKKHNPDRVLVLGLLSQKELLTMALVLAVVLFCLNALFSLTVAAVLIIDFVYALLLWFSERLCKILRDNALVNLIFTYPVQLILSIYIIFSIQEQYGFNAIYSTWLCVIAVMLAYLHFEFARKSVWGKSKQRENFYSSLLGARNAGIITLVLGVGAIAVAIWGLLPYTKDILKILSIIVVSVTGVFLVLGCNTFFRDRKSWPVHFSVFFLLSFLSALSIQTVIQMGISV